VSGFDVDLFVIGGGSGGVRASRIAAGEHGARVALAEEYRMGGTCVIRGCVPKKLMVFASGFPAAMAEARAYGWQVTAGGFDWTAFRLKLDAELDRLEAAYRAGLKGAGVAVYNTRAVIEEPQLVRLATGERLRARHILVATGGRPFVPEFPGAEHAITSNEIFKLEALPGTALVVGGGFISCEFASIFNGLGVKVTQYYRGTQVLRGFDDEARAHIGGQLVEAGVDLRLGADVAAIERRPGGLCVRGIDGGEAVFDAVVYATGRVPNTAGLGLEAAGVKLGRRGEILVDGWSQSSVPWLHAVGDVTDRINLTPVAIREGHAYADTVFGGTPRQPDHELVASAVFTQPCELGTVGLTEEEARTAGPVEIYATSFRPMRGAFAGRSHRVLMKLVVSAETRKVLGCHIVAPEAGEMIQMVAIAIKMGASKEDFDRTCAVHPSMAEELVTMRKPARAG
jgi:glutathione reductase (NADPH)